MKRFLSILLAVALCVSMAPAALAADNGTLPALGDSIPSGYVEAMGVSTFESNDALAVQNEALNMTLSLYNNESSDFDIESINFTVTDLDGNVTDITDQIVSTTVVPTEIESMGTADYSFYYVYDGLGSTIYTATITGTLNGATNVYSEPLTVSYVSADMVTNVVVDGSHYNDYVTGYYGGNMSELETITANQSIKLSIVTNVEDYYGEDSVLDDCSLLIISAPAKKSGTSNTGDYTASHYEDEFIEAVQAYVQAGGSVIVCGLADYGEASSSAEYHTAAQQNRLLAAVGSSMSINDDEAYDTTNNGGQAYRLYLEEFNMESEWLSGVVDVGSVANGEDYQVYSQYSGCTVNVGNGTWLVKGFDTTYSIDSDKDGANDTVGNDGTYDIVTSEGSVVLLACEVTEYGGTIFVSGGVFCSDVEVDADVDDYNLPYANTTIITNILNDVKVNLPVTDIATVRAAYDNGAGSGSIYKVRGYVTAGTANEDNAFFDRIYIQDETGGIDIFPYAESGLELGTYMEVTGYLASYQGDIELKVMSYTILDSENLNVVEPTLVTCAEGADYAANGGKLIQVKGTVGSVYYNSGGTLAQFTVSDSTGEAVVFIDGYILSGTTGENTLAETVTTGATVSAVGILYMHPETLATDDTFGEEVAVLRVRDCDEVVVTDSAAKQIYTVSIGSLTNGTVDVNSEEAGAAANAEVILTVTPATGYELDTLLINEGEVTYTDNKDGTYTFIMPASNVTVTATFKAKTTYTITVDTEIENGEVTADSENATAGTSVTLIVTADDDYELGTLTVTDGDGNDVEVTPAADGTYTFTMPDSAVTITATFTETPTAPSTYTVTVPTTSNGTVSVDKTTAAEGDVVTITVAPDAYYAISELAATDEDGVEVELTYNATDGTYSFFMPDSAVTVTVTFAEYILQENREYDGEQLYIKIEEGIPAVPEQIADLYPTWTTDDMKQELKTYIEKMNSDLENTAIYNVTLHVTTDGGLTWVDVTDDYFKEYGSLRITVPYPDDTDSSYSFTVAHMFETTYGNHTAGQIEPCTDVSNGTDGMSFTVHGMSPIIIGWEKSSTPTRPTYFDEDISYRITTADTTHGTTTLSDTRAYEGDKVTITVTPDDGYELSSLTVTTSSGKEVKLTQKSDTKYTFTMPSSKVTITAAFVKVEEEEDVLGTLIKVDPATPFTDISNSRFKSAIAEVYAAGLINGVSETTFDPEGTLTRAMVVTVLYRLAGEPAVTATSTFSDVGTGLWYTDAVVWATENGVVNGYTDGTFKPEQAVTREELATILYRYASANGYHMGNTFALDGFSDSAAVQSYAVAAVEWAVGNSVLVSRTAAMLNAGEAATRAEVAQALSTLIK